MKIRDPLLTAWEETLARRGDAVAIVAADGSTECTFRGIETRARAFESKIDGFDPGSVLAVQIGNHPAWPEILLACWRRELITLPLETTIRDSERDAALKMSNAQAVVTAGPGRTGIVIGGRDINILPPVTAVPATHWDEQASLLKLTSGTTAAPRAIRFRSEQLLADCNQICATMGISNTDLNFGVIPVSHSYGFSNLLLPLIARGVPIVLSRDRLPRAVLVDLARTGATVFPGMPVFYQAFCEMEDVPALPKLRLCISAGAPLNGSLARKFHSKFGQAIHSFYGSSECGGICYDRNGTTFEDGFVGLPMQDVDLEFIDAAAESGQVRVRSAAAGNGYFPEPNESKLGAGVFIPDDLLTRCDAGYKIVGRISDVINVAGKKVNPAHIEEQLLRFSGVRQAVAFGIKSSQRNEEVAACVVAETNISESELLEFCRRQLSGWQAPKRIFIVEEIPVNERGKISRRELAARFARG